MRELIIGKNDAGQRLDKFLSKAVPALPVSMMYKSIRTKKIKVNRKRAEQNTVLAVGDTVQLFLKEEFFSSPAKDSSALYHIQPKLDVVYEDENVILLNKRPGVLVHEDTAGNENTLIMHLQAYLVRNGEYDPEDEQSFAPALCNRIDRNTGGIVIAAKTAAALREMNEHIKLGHVGKFYLCAVHGILDKKTDTLTGWLFKDSRTNKVYVTDEKQKGSKEIITKYRVLKEKNDCSLLEVRLITGRTHQIRAHFSHIGHPLVGDGKYGINRDDRERGYKFQALYAYRLIFEFPSDGGELAYLSGKEFSVPTEKIRFVGDFNA